MKELKVRERVTIEVVESPSCAGYYFKGSNTCPDGCCDYERSDGNWIIFKEIKEQKRNIKKINTH